MKSTPKHVVLLVQLENGEMVQRPLTRQEINFVLPIISEFDGGTLKVMPVPDGIVMEKRNGN